MSSRAVWKYPIPLQGAVTLDVPKGGTFRTIQMQREPCVWVEVDPNAPTESRRLYVIGTGQPFDTNDVTKYIGTWQNGGFVWHLYEAHPAPEPKPAPVGPAVASFGSPRRAS